MDNVFLAVAGVGLIVVGVLGMVVSLLITFLAAIRFAVLPRLAPTMTRLRTEAGAWFAPPVPREPVLVRAERPRR